MKNTPTKPADYGTMPTRLEAFSRLAIGDVFQIDGYDDSFVKRCSGSAKSLGCGLLKNPNRFTRKGGIVSVTLGTFVRVQRWPRPRYAVCARCIPETGDPVPGAFDISENGCHSFSLHASPEPGETRRQLELRGIPTADAERLARAMVAP